MQYYMLKEVCEINPSKQIDLSLDDKISFVPMDSVSVRGDIDTSKSISVSSIKTYSVFREGDVLFAKITPCMENGKGCIAHGLLNGYGAGSTEFIVLRPDSRLLTNKWLYYFLSQQSFRQECKQHMTGSAGQKRVPPKYLGNCSIPVPSISEQQRIIARVEELFSQLDDGMETLNKTELQLLRYRRSVIKDGLDNVSSTIHTVDTTIGEICDCLDSLRRPVNQKDRAKCKGLYPYYGANGETGRIDDYIFDEELVLICEDETFVGRTKPFSYMISGKSWVNNHAHILRGKAGVVRNKYLNYILSYYPFLPIVTGTTGRKKLTQAALLNAPVRIVDYDYQNIIVQQIESRLSVCDSIEQTVNYALQQVEAMRQSILKEYY